MWAQLHTTRCSRWTWAHRTSASAFLANRTCCLYAYASPHVLRALPGSSVTTPWPTAALAVSFLSVDSWLPRGMCSCCSVVKSCPALWDPMDCSTPGFPVLRYLLEFAQIHSIEPVMLSNHLILCRPFLLLPSIFLSIRVFSNELALCMRWPKYWSFSFSLSSEYSGLISFRINWFDLLAVQGTLKSFLQHHNLKASILPTGLSAPFVCLLPRTMASWLI